MDYQSKILGEYDNELTIFLADVIQYFHTRIQGQLIGLACIS
jgi:hypothetical protein